MLRLFVVSIVAVIALCGCYDNHNRPASEEFSEQANCTIAQLKMFCKSGCYNITSDMVCIGRITSSDREGNFYRSVFVEDNTAAVEVKLGIYNIEAQYPVGLLVALRLNGTAVSLADNVLQLGLPPQSYDTAPREFEAQEVIDHHIVRSNSVSEVSATEYHISDLATSLCGRFVKLSDLRYEPLVEESEESEEARNDYLRFIDSDNNVVFAYISPYANFANSVIPTEPLSIQGVLYHEAVGMGLGRQFVIKPRSKDDFTTLDNPI